MLVVGLIRGEPAPAEDGGVLTELGVIARVVVPADVSDDAMKDAALASDRVQSKLEGKEVVKTIVVPGKLVNFVVK